MRSPPEKENWPWLGSVASHFISFSGVTMENSRSRMPTYVESPSFPAETAVPKYRPVWAADAPSVEAAPADVASTSETPSDVAKNVDASAAREIGFMAPPLSRCSSRRS